MHAFYVSNCAKEAFTGIASRSGGVSGFLDVNASDAADQLTDVVCMRLLKNVEEVTGTKADLVGKYRELFDNRRRYVA